jgi:hypothetical protein
MCLGFHCPICDSVRHDNGVTFEAVSYVLCLGFLSVPTELARVTDLLMLQNWKYGRVLVMWLLFGQSFVMFLLFANVAE